MIEKTHEKIKKIKQSFRLMMNGETSRSMRDKGVFYNINWGVPIPLLKEKAKEYGKDYELAVELWKEDIRECKILATMIMPSEQMPLAVVDIWMEQIKSQEMAEIAAFNLFQYLDYAPVLAFKLMASDNDIRQTCAYHILARLFMNGQEPNERGINEFLDQVSIALQSETFGVRHAAATCLHRFALLGDEYDVIARNALKPVNLDFF